MIMKVQFAILAVILAFCVAWFLRYLYREYRQNLKCNDYGCAGCALYEKCKKTRKK